MAVLSRVPYSRRIPHRNPPVAPWLLIAVNGVIFLAELMLSPAALEQFFYRFGIVPGGTLIALAADEIVMSEHAVIGPVDPQLGQYAGASILNAVARKPVAEVDDQTLILADQAEKAISQVRDSVRELLADQCPSERKNELTRLLSAGPRTPDYPDTHVTATGSSRLPS